MTDQFYDECIKRICAGDRDGLKLIYDAYLGYIFGVISGILRNREDAEDVTSEFFIRIWNTAEQYKPGHGHKTYITTIARNMCIDFLRKKGREIPADLSGGSEAEENELYQNAGEEPVSKAAHVPGFEDTLVEGMTLKAAIATLGREEQEIIHLKFGGDLTFKEISHILKIPMGTVTWRYREAIKKLRRCGYE